MKQDYEMLQENIEEISKILPVAPSPLQYSKLEEIQIQSYYMLVHAEFEYFFENCAKEKIKSIISEYKISQKPHSAILSLIFTFLKEDETVKAIRKSSSIENLIDYMLAKYISSINSNHGIKEENLIKIYSPIGVDITKFFNPYMMGEINTLSSKRGEFAHHALHVKSLEDARIAKQRTNVIVSEVGKFYSYLRDY